MVGRTVTVTVDRPLGSYHPKFPRMRYPVNYGYVEGIPGGDGQWQDAYILGISEPVSRMEGRVIAVIRRLDDVEDKWVVAPSGMRFSEEEIRYSTYFQERYFTVEIRLV